MLHCLVLVRRSLSSLLQLLVGSELAGVLRGSLDALNVAQVSFIEVAFVSLKSTLLLLIDHTSVYLFDSFLEVMELDHVNVNISSERQVRFTDHSFLVLSAELFLLLLLNQLASVNGVLVRLPSASLNCEFDNSFNTLLVKG